MKRFLLLSWMLVMAVPSLAQAGAADAFRGTYDIIAPSYPDFPGDHYMLVDTGTLEGIWAKYDSRPLPAELVPLKNESTIIVGFNDRIIRFLTLEKSALITPTYLSVSGGEGRQLEMKRAANGTFDVGIQYNGATFRLRTAAPAPLTPPSDGTESR